MFLDQCELGQRSLWWAVSILIYQQILRRPRTKFTEILALRTWETRWIYMNMNMNNGKYCCIMAEFQTLNRCYSLKVELVWLIFRKALVARYVLPRYQNFSQSNHLFQCLEYLPLYTSSLLLSYEDIWDSSIESVDTCKLQIPTWSFWMRQWACKDIFFQM